MTFEARLRRALPLLLILAACEDPLPTGPFDAGAAVCFQPLDSGVFAKGLVSPVPGCARTDQDAGVLDLAQMGWAPAGGLLVVPPGAGNVPLPVVFVFHGAFSSGPTVRDRFQLEPAADGGAIFLYPNATAGTWDLGRTSLDGRLVDRLLRSLSDSYCIDPQRIHVAGFSAGAVFTLFMGCNEARTFAGLGAVAGTDLRFDTRCCTAPIPGILIHGMDDTTIRFIDGLAARNSLLDRNGCTAAATPDGANCLTYPGCASGKSVDWCAWDGDHDIPPWGGEEVWGFFAGLP